MTANLDPWDQALLDALEGGANTEPPMTLEELAAKSALPLTLLEVVAREGFLRPVSDQPDRYDPRDLEPIQAGMEMVEAGLPLGELLDLARRVDAAMEPIAEQAVDVFARFVRDSVEVSSRDETEAADRLVRALTTMLPAAGRLVDHHFRALLVDRARARFGS